MTRTSAPGDSPHRHQPSRRYLRAAIVAAVATLGLAPTVGAHAGAPSDPVTAYQRFCYNNSDLCTVTERVLNIDRTTTYVLKCTLDVSANHCPPSGVIIAGPYYRLP